MDILTADFETAYSKTYTLKKLTTEEYIRSPEFETIGVSVKRNADPAVWFSGSHTDIDEFLHSFDWANSVAVAHHSAFDMAILNWHYDIRPKKIVDTLSMARALHGTEVGGSLAALAQHYGIGVKGTEVLNALGKRRADFTPEKLSRYGEYCINDVELTYELFKCMAPGFPVSELNLIDLTIRMFTEPKLLLDLPLLEEHLTEVRERKEKLLSTVAADKKDLMSNPKFAELLRQHGVEPPMKISPTTGKETYAFAKSDEDFKALLEHENEAVQALVAARLGTKSTLEETRTERFINIAKRGTLPIPLKYYAARTGRWSGSGGKLNAQNLPRGSKLKKAIVAPEGYVVIDCDSSQIEARTLAWLAGQTDLVEAFDRGEDVYKIMASAIYNKPKEEITKDERFVGKSTILGSGYGMSGKKFRKQLSGFGVALPEAECERIISVYRETYPCIPMLWRTAGNAILAVMNDQYMEFGCGDILKVEGEKGIRLPNGFYIKYPNIRRHTNKDGKSELVYDVQKGRAIIPTRIYSAKSVENLCQGLARIVIGEQMNAIAKRYPVVLTVHDAVACIAREEEADEARAYVEECMRMRPVWAPDLPLNCESGVGKSYGDC